ncbi:hypothetical protein LC040_02455 [Bacillus tianshenii]|nr:hypothetical protein LC040_02455 [Bacillus tianshenii]
MKKLILLLITSIMLALLTGCVKFNTHITVNKDGSLNLKQTIGVTKEMLALAGENNDMFSEADIAKMREDGYKVEPFEDDAYMGYQMTRTFASLKELETTGAFPTGEKQASSLYDSFSFKEKNGLFKQTIIIDGNLDFSSTTGDALNGFLGNSIKDSMDLSFSATLPLKPKQHNADSIDGNTYTWKLQLNEPNNIHLELNLWKTKTIGFLILFVLLLSTITILYLKKKR